MGCSRAIDISSLCGGQSADSVAVNLLGVIEPGITLFGDGQVTPIGIDHRSTPE